MRIIPVEEATEGDLLVRGLHDKDGRLILSHGVRLTHKLIDGIKRYGHRYVFVRSDGAQDEKEFASKTNIRNLTRDMLLRIFRALRERTPLSSIPLRQWADHIADSAESGQGSDSEFCLSNLEFGEDELLSHSLNVTLLSLIVARKLGCKRSALVEVAIGSLLHDVGLVRPMDTALVMHHPVIGLDTARQFGGIPEASLRIIEQHHEQVDGRGFPYGLKGEGIDEASQIVGLASEFDLFLRNGGRSARPCEGVDFVMSKVDTYFSYAVVNAFVKTYRPYPNGTRVRLTGGLRGTVCEQNRGNSCRPIVRLAPFDSRFDLLAYTMFRIEEVVEEPAAASGTAKD
ncbi:HD-GYP domain-containing protein [Cohnella fermenti]|nr:HD domain-containing protein [Cohnella fermenti]